VFLDETGLMLQPLVRRTWAPEGQTPVMYSWDRRDRLSVTAALSLSARRRRIGLYFDIQERNIAGEDTEAFLRQVQRALGRKWIVVMDRWAVQPQGGQALSATSDSGSSGCRRTRRTSTRWSMCGSIRNTTIWRITFRMTC